MFSFGCVNIKGRKLDIDEIVLFHELRIEATGSFLLILET
jgi:hypothetical protein